MYANTEALETSLSVLYEFHYGTESESKAMCARVWGSVCVYSRCVGVCVCVCVCVSRQAGCLERCAVVDIIEGCGACEQAWIRVVRCL